MGGKARLPFLNMFCLKKTFSALALLIFALAKFTEPILAKTATAAPSAVLFNPSLKQSAEKRILKLGHFLASVNSPLSSYAPDFVKTADKYKIDWQLVPAITGVESSFGLFIPPNSYNAYGWNNGNYYFQNWRESIEVVSKTLRENYYDRGAKTVEQIAPIYAPPSKNWAGKVRYFMNRIEATSLPLQLTL